MDLSIILCWQTMVVALSASVVMIVLKRLSNSTTIKFMDWKPIQMFMPLIPIAIAMLFSIAIHPDELTTISQIVIWSLIAGMASTFGFKLFKTIFLEQIGLKSKNKEDEEL